MSKSKYFTSTPSDVLFRLPRSERSTKEVIKDYSGSSGDRPSREELRRYEMYQVAWSERDIEPEPAACVPPPSEPRKKRTHFDGVRKADGSPREDSSTTTTSNTGNLRLATQQLIVVTHTGDWFRLGVPDGQGNSISGEVVTDSEGEDGDENTRDYTTIRPTSRATDRADRCKVLEYRRMRTVSAEW